MDALFQRNTLFWVNMEVIIFIFIIIIINIFLFVLEFIKIGFILYSIIFIEGIMRIWVMRYVRCMVRQMLCIDYIIRTHIAPMVRRIIIHADIIAPIHNWIIIHKRGWWFVRIKKLLIFIILIVIILAVIIIFIIQIIIIVWCIIIEILFDVIVCMTLLTLEVIGMVICIVSKTLVINRILTVDLLLLSWINIWVLRRDIT